MNKLYCAVFYHNEGCAPYVSQFPRKSYYECMEFVSMNKSPGLFRCILHIRPKL